MPLNETAAKQRLKIKLKAVRDNITDADEALDGLVDALYEIIKELKDNATVTGICPPNGGALTQGKIT